MTKEAMIQKVETAHEIFEKLQKFPLHERHSVLRMVEDFNQDDWAKYHNANGAGLTSKCANEPTPVPC